MKIKKDFICFIECYKKVKEKCIMVTEKLQVKFRAHIKYVNNNYKNTIYVFRKKFRYFYY